MNRIRDDGAGFLVGGSGARITLYSDDKGVRRGRESDLRSCFGGSVWGRARVEVGR